MSEEDRSLSAIYNEAEDNRLALDGYSSSNSAEFQGKLKSAIDLYEQCLLAADRISLFSPNESLEDIATADLKYLLLNQRLAELAMRLNGPSRKADLTRAQNGYDRFLRQLDHYDLLSKRDTALLELFHESPASFTVISTANAAERRDMKIKRFREEKSLRDKLRYLRTNQAAQQNEEGPVRELHLAEIAYYIHQSFHSMESIAQELHIISLAPPMPPPQPDSAMNTDIRDRDNRNNAAYSERLDMHLPQVAGLRGPLLDKTGKPLRPFTLTSKRQEFANGVFRPDHSLPTMSIDEYLEEERRRGGIIEGGGPQSGLKPAINEDDMEAADRETMKAREWDEFVEANPKGSGNTTNRG